MINTIITRKERALLEEIVSAKTLFGISHIRSSADRKNNCEKDQRIGIYGELAFFKFLGGNVDQYLDYKFSMNKADDVPGMPDIDVKSSPMRIYNRFNHLHMYVCDAEYKPSTKYVLALIRSDFLVWIPGWSYGWKMHREQNRRSMPVPELDDLNTIIPERTQCIRTTPRQNGSSH